MHNPHHSLPSRHPKFISPFTTEICSPQKLIAFAIMLARANIQDARRHGSECHVYRLDNSIVVLRGRPRWGRQGLIDGLCLQVLSDRRGLGLVNIYHKPRRPKFLRGREIFYEKLTRPFLLALRSGAWIVSAMDREERPWLHPLLTGCDREGLWKMLKKRGIADRYGYVVTTKNDARLLGQAIQSAKARRREQAATPNQ